MCWKELVAAGKPKPSDPAAKAAPPWNPTDAQLQPVEDALGFAATQQARAERDVHAHRAAQQATAFSNLYGYHFAAGSLPQDAMEGLARGDAEERSFDAPLQARLLAALRCTQTQATSASTLCSSNSCMMRGRLRLNPPHHATCMLCTRARVRATGASLRRRTCGG